MKGEHYHEWKYNEVEKWKYNEVEKWISGIYVKYKVLRFCTQCLEYEIVDLKEKTLST